MICFIVIIIPHISVTGIFFIRRVWKKWLPRQHAPHAPGFPRTFYNKIWVKFL